MDEYLCHLESDSEIDYPAVPRAAKEIGRVVIGLGCEGRTHSE